jgi:MFS family permease
MRERRALYVSAFLRAVTTGLVGVLLGVYLARLDISGPALGSVLSFGLAGAALAAAAATFFGDALGRRRCLLLLTLLSVVGTVAFAFGKSPVFLSAAAFVGMLNGMGKDRGAALILEQAALPGTTTAKERTRVVAWYTMLQDLGHATGAALAGLPALLQEATPLRGAEPHRAVLLGCAALGVVTLVLYRRLGSGIDADVAARRTPVSAKSRAILTKLCALFAIDSLAGGFLTTAMLAYFFFERFGIGEGWIAALFFGARLMNAVSHLGAAWLAKHIGLVKTMVFTHMPSSMLLITVAFAPSFPIAACLFLLREGLVEMDVPTRQSYVLAVVNPEERTFASGVTNLVRLAAWSVAPVFAGILASGRELHRALVLGATLKIIYDLLLWLAFRAVRPPEEAASTSSSN